jgi:hypothetical protein
MRPVLSVLLASCFLLTSAFLVSDPAAAGDYGYRDHYYGDSYSDNYRDNNYSAGAYDHRSYSDQPRHYYGYDYANSTSYSDQPRHFYSENCSPRRFKLHDDGGGWVWATRTDCN